MNRTSIEWVLNPDGSRPGWSWSPITGCLNYVNGLCNGGRFPCYAYKLANGRLRQRYLANTNLAPDAKGGVMKLSIKEQTTVEREGDYADPFYPRFWEDGLNDIKRPEYPFSDWSNNNASRTIPLEFLPINRHAKRKAKGIFTCDMSDLFGIGVPEEWTRKVLDAIQINGVDRFYLLTKQPQNLIKFSPFPENCWVGVTATSRKMAWDAFWDGLIDTKAKIKYLSLEPLIDWAPLPKDPTNFNIKFIDECRGAGIGWLIIGACTGTVKEMSHLVDKYPHLTPMQWRNKWTAQPRIEWVKDIVEAADKAGVKVFLKNNLRPLLIPEDCSKPNYLTEDIFWASDKAQLRQEMPE